MSASISRIHADENGPAEPRGEGATPSQAETLDGRSVRRKNALTPDEKNARIREGGRLGRAITMAGSSQEAVARALGITRTAVAKIIRGAAPLRAEQREALPPRVRATYHELAAQSAIDDAHHVPMPFEQGLLLAYDALSDARREWAAAHEDGRCDPQERTRVLARIGRVKRLVQALERAVDNATAAT